ncbi:acyl-CoA synthetase [Gordonia insulae]|uniref:Long-chain-fatty-acid--CoA ligase n=1 Tax=Gordonia insulae TaxID=2420509 RepID=A0A3G8JMQ0_9ACTN|nr:acyl-CoA synthetase [Gordonia insulae]AZG46354.1 Long-chain-fatty-acid--CoA ligase [Gordonia insulae]
MSGALDAIKDRLDDIARNIKSAAVLQRTGVLDFTDPKAMLRGIKWANTMGAQASLILRNAQEYPDAPALADERGEMTYRELSDGANALANAMLTSGIEPGSVVGVLARDHRGLLLSITAAGRAGYKLALMNTGFAKPQFAEVAARENLRAVLHDSEFIDLLGALPADIPRYLTWSDGEHGDYAAPIVDDVIASGDTTLPPLPASPGGFIILTSGTTGLPKGAPRGKMNPFASAMFVDRIPFPERGSVVIVSPIFHSTGFGMWGVSTAKANKAVLLRRFDAEKTLAALADHRAEMLVAVPTMLHRMIALGPETFGNYDLSALRAIVIAGSPLTPALSEAVQDAFGDVLYNMYGSTEVAVASVAQPQELRLAPGTVGRSTVAGRLRLYDEDDRQLTDNHQSGRLFVRSSAPFEGYTDGRHKQIIDGYMSTGDMAHFDDHGLLHIDGRDDDMIVSGGENVYPGEVENLLAEHADIDDVAVVGVEDDEFGTRLRAFVVPTPGAAPTEQDIRDHVRSQLARYKVPRDVIFLDELPRNPTGKLLRRELIARGDDLAT